MQAKKLMTELTDQGVEFFVQGREIRIISGKGIITDAIMSRLVVRKPEMIKILSESQTLRLVVDNTEANKQ